MFAELLNESGLSLERLSSFWLVAQSGGLTKAAKGDPTRQSLFSRQIKELEEFFGAELIRRKGRGIELTEAGRRLEAVAHEFAVALTDLKSTCKCKPVEVAIGTGESVIQWVIVPHLDELRKRLQNVRIKLLNLPTSDAVSRLTDGSIDLAIVRKDAVKRPLKSRALGVMRFSLFVPKGLQAVRRSDCASLFSSLPLASLEGDGTFRTELEEQARSAGIRLNTRVECPSFPLVARTVASGSVAAVLPRIAMSDLKDRGIEELPVPFLKDTGREMVLAINPRMLRIRPFLQSVTNELEQLCRF